MTGSHLVAVDIGGTFTDLVLMDVTTGQSHVTKVLTTPSDPVEAVRAGVLELLETGGISGGDLESVIHATTLATNTVTEAKGARVALLGTEGFRDILEMGREGRYDAYDLQIQVPRPLVDREARLGVRERVDYAGNVLTPLEPAEIERAVAAVRDAGAEAVAVCLLHSYAAPEHEALLGAALREQLPDVPVSLSSEVLPRRGEFERMVATVVNSYVLPRMQVYLRRFAGFCGEIGHEGPLFLMMSNGGMAGVDVASRHPVRMIESGPAAGVIAASRVARGLDLRRVLSFDMGGTTAKACLVQDFEPRLAENLEVARLQRFAPGSGYPLAVPSVDLLEIGAGGGSIARVTSLGLLEVGPDSAGADPGPACYGRGGELPTVTDANLVLGFLNPDYFLGGRMTVSRDAADAALAGNLAERLEREPIECAWGVYDVVNEQMARALRIHAVAQGVDPRDCSMVAFGGAGPVHACAVAAKLAVSHVVCPTGAGVGSAFGLARAPRVSEELQTHVVPLDAVDDDTVQVIRAELLDRALGSGEDRAAVDVRYLVDVRLAGQLYEVTLPLGERIDPAELGRAFADEYEPRIGRRPGEGRLEIVNWRIRAEVGGTGAGQAHAMGGTATAQDGESIKGSRGLYLGPSGQVEATVVDRYAMAAGESVTGPAVIEERESTVVVLPGFHASMDEDGNLHLRPKQYEAVPATLSAAELETR